MPKLTDVKIKNAIIKAREYKLSDGNALFLVVKPTGGKLFQFRYRYNNKQKTLSLGKYPDVSLSSAREKLTKAREQLANNLDPSSQKKSLKLQKKSLFHTIALEWYDKKKGEWKENHKKVVWRRIERYLLPKLTNKPINEIETIELLIILNSIQENGSEIAKRVFNYINNIFIHARHSGLITINPADKLGDTIKISPKKSLPGFTDPKKLKTLLIKIDAYTGSPVVKSALQLLALVFVRPGELRFMEWSEISFEKQEWLIPASKMKMKREHIVPLSSQALQILIYLKKINGNKKYVFSTNQKDIPLSDNATNKALRILGYDTKNEHCSHGFRTTASTLLNEQGYNSAWIEKQLAHEMKNKVAGVYNKAEYLPGRKNMMEEWSNYLDELKNE